MAVIRNYSNDNSGIMNKSEIGRLKLISIVLSDTSWRSIMKIMENPPRPNEALKKAFQEYSKIVNKSDQN